MKDRRYVQVLCSRDLTAAGSFGGGQQYFRFNVEQGQRWDPSKSFLQMKTALTKTGGAQLTVDDGVAFACNPVASAYQAVELRLMGRDIAKYESGFVAQCDTLLKRIRVSKGHMELLKQSEWLDESLDNRINRLAQDGVLQTDQVVGYADLGYAGAQTIALSATGLVTFGSAVPNATTVWAAGDIMKVSLGGASINYFQVAAVPSSSTVQLTANTAYSAFAATALTTNPIWRVRRDIGAAITAIDLTWEFGQMLQTDVSFGPGSYELVLTPYSGETWKNHMVESRTAKSAGAAGSFDVSIQNGFFWACIYDAPTPDGAEINNIEQVICRTFNYPSTTTRQDLRYDVPPTTRAISVALQSADAGTTTAHSASRFITYDGVEKTLNRFNIQYKNQNSNQPEIDPSYKSGNLYDYRQEFYRKCMMNSGRWFDPSGTEDFGTYGGKSSVDYGLGQYYYHEFMADPKNMASSAVVTSQYASSPSNAVQLVFSHVTRRVRSTYKDGRCVDVSVEDYTEA